MTSQFKTNVFNNGANTRLAVSSHKDTTSGVGGQHGIAGKCCYLRQRKIQSRNFPITPHI